MKKSPKIRAQSHPQDKTDLYALLVEEVKDYAIFTLDLKNRITSWNTGARRMVGWVATLRQVTSAQMKRGAVRLPQSAAMFALADSLT